MIKKLISQGAEAKIYLVTTSTNNDNLNLRVGGGNAKGSAREKGSLQESNQPKNKLK